MKVLSFKDNKDGSATMEYEITTKERQAIKKYTGVKRLTKKRINKEILKAIKDSLQKDKIDKIFSKKYKIKRK